MFLNQQGDWVRPVPEITYFSAENVIDFTNNGGDDWDISFKIIPDNLQLPTVYSIVDYDYFITFSVLLVLTNIDSGTTNNDYTVNTSGNGEGVYYIETEI